MDGLRAKVTAIADGKDVHVVIEWVDVVDNVPCAVQFREEFRVKPDQAGSAYFSRVALADAVVSPGTFWVDTAGKRHFVVDAAPGHIGVVGSPVRSDNKETRR